MEYIKVWYETAKIVLFDALHTFHIGLGPHITGAHWSGCIHTEIFCAALDKCLEFSCAYVI